MMGRRLASLALATLLMNAGVIVVGCGNDAGGGHRAAHDGGWTGDTSGAGTVGTSADASMPGAAEAGGLSFADDAATNMSDGGVDAPYSPGETNTEAEASDGSTTDRSDGAVTGDSNAVSMTDGGTDCDAGEDSRVPWQDRDSEADSGLWTPPFDEAQQVVWKTPSADSQGSLPLGNGDIGVNAWLEPNGDVVFYVSKTDAWSAHGRLLKVGRIRVSLPGAGPIMNVLQHLDTKQGEAEFVLGPPDSPTTIRLWVDANVPVVRCEIASDTPQTARVLLESWRTQPRELLPEERDSAYGLIGSSQQIIESIDTILDETNTLMWYHRNEESIWTESLKRQGMGGWSEHGRDPLLHRTFGGLLWGKNFVREDSTSLRSAAAARQQRFALHVLTKQTETVEEWRKAVVALSDEARIDWDVALKAHRTWWREFWERSWIHLPAGDLFDIDQGYLLQRYVTPCAGRGFSPIKFNGSIFTVDAQVGTQKLDADYRRWGGAYWFQNTG